MQAPVPTPLSLVAKSDPDTLRKQQSLNTPPVYDKMPIDYAQSDRYKSLDIFNRSFNKAAATLEPSTQSQSTSQHQQAATQQQPPNHQQVAQQQVTSQQPAHSQPATVTASSAELHYYMQRSTSSQIPAADYTMTGQTHQRYDLSRQTPAAHQQPAMSNMNYKGTPAEYMRNFASLMADMGLPGEISNFV